MPELNSGLGVSVESGIQVMQTKRRGIGAGRSEAEGVLTIDASAKREVPNRTQNDQDGDIRDATSRRKFDRVEGALEGIGYARRKRVSSRNRSQDNPVPRAVGGDGDRVRAGEHGSVGYV